MPTTQKIQTHKHIEFMKQFFILLGLSICLMSLSAQEAYQYNQFYYQRSTLFEKLPIDSDDIVFLGNSITNGCEWHELFNNPNIKNRGISSDVSGVVRCGNRSIYVYFSIGASPSNCWFISIIWGVFPIIVLNRSKESFVGNKLCM